MPLHAGGMNGDQPNKRKGTNMTAYDAGWIVMRFTGDKGYGWYVRSPYGEHVAGPYDTRESAIAARDALYAVA